MLLNLVVPGHAVNVDAPISRSEGCYRDVTYRRYVSLEARTRRSVDEHVDRLRATYGDAPVVEETKRVPSARFRSLARVALDGYLNGAAAFVRDDGRLLPHRPVDSDRWTAPGGGWEDGETFVETAVREVREETGIDCDVTGLRFVWLVRYVAGEEESSKNELAGERADAVWQLNVFFEGRYVDGDPVAEDEEVADVGWFESVPESVPPLIARFARVETQA